MGHATASYLGFVKNYKYIWEACEDPVIKLITLNALLEASIALSLESKHPLKDLIEHGGNLLYRFGNRLLGDTIARVGKDPVRKLSEKDRLVGAANLCLKNEIYPTYIAIGIAAGYVFFPPGDKSAERVKKVIDEYGIDMALRKFSNVKNDWPLFNQVVEFYRMLKQNKSLEYIEKEAERIKQNENVQ